MFSSADKLIAPTIGDPTVESAQLLFIRVICQAVEDHGTPSWRAEVDAFFSGPDFARYCGLLGWNRDWARHRIQAFIEKDRELAGATHTSRNTNLDLTITRPLAS